jgi:glutamine amidotransferase
MITIVDYGLGNLGSIQNMLRRIGVDNVVTRDVGQVARATKLILPGVGAFDAGMRNLREFGLFGVLNEKARQEKVPVLGICLGMQLMTAASEEGILPGLGWVDASVRRFSSASGRKVPHMGWRQVEARKDCGLVAGLETGARFYFVHSYFVACASPEDVLLTADYGATFDAAFAAGNIMGVQFHPEKSHRFGMRLLRNFAAL